MNKTKLSDLPQTAVEYIDSVIKAMKYRRKVRAEVRKELMSHFSDALTDCESEQQQQDCVKELIKEFGNVKMLGKLMRLAKKRCRPLWQQATLVVFKVIGIIFLLLLLRVGYMATGRPTISVDYTQWMNDKVRDGRDESLNAYHDYQRAIELMSKDMPPEIEKIEKYPREQQKTPEDWLAIEAFLETEAEAIKVFRQGTAKPYYWNIYKATKEHGKLMAFPADVMENLMPKLSPIKKIARRIVYFQIPLDIHRGNTKQAVDDSIALYIYGQHLHSQGVLIEQLVGVAIEAMAISGITDVLSQVDLSASELHRFQKIVEKDYDPDIAPMDWSLEKAFWYDAIQRAFTDDGQGNGRPLPRGTLFAVSNRMDYLTGLISGFPDRKEVVDDLDEFFERFNAYRKFKPKTLHGMEEQGLFRVDKLQFMQQVSDPAMRKTIEISWRMRAGQAGLIGTLAVLRFEKETGRLPDNWGKLLGKGYFKTIPMDPYSDGPLIYKKTDAGFTLYSVGSNFIDDGGVPGTDKDGEPKKWGENGDIIFWPVVP
ncbi:MAG: hypothetical protein DRP56_09405 [Planctomycetota bacterium]|nr:MAG: hypothetical protein DRP56_09405 [Planctomycetota bacterium]